MPHKKAKSSICRQERSKKSRTHTGSRRGRSILGASPPKSFAGAINAAQVRADFPAKRKLAGKDVGEDGPTKKTKRRKDSEKGDTRIRPGETLAHFNKRPLVRSAVQSSLATVRAQHKKAASASDLTASTSASNSTNLTTPKLIPNPAQIQITDARRLGCPRINLNRQARLPPQRIRATDLLAPPELRKLKPNPNAKTTNIDTHTKPSILSPAQALQMAAAREAVVAHYRALKAARRGADWDGGERGDGGGRGGRGR
ncbi:hypothetical protein K438DRAFT_1960606 [Mycena galopus ATCC 62051]|nr:hypothetical protein K438DRAFT_1960606 [Mycena galopus ATCC 62051]